MISAFLNRRLQHFAEWWRAPTKPRDRVMGATIGGLGCFWIGVIGRLLLGPLPVSLATLGWWALGSVILGIILGVVFPKIIATVCFPFSLFGGSGS
jgi:hypothetical protein